MTEAVRKSMDWFLYNNGLCHERVKLIKSKYRISIRGPTLWNNIPTNSQKMLESLAVFKNSMREKLLEIGNEI